MRIIYIAKHDQALSNDDEGSILHCLRQFGHTVEPVREYKGKRATRLKGDLLLFHHWDDPAALDAFEGLMPRVFWYFDLVNYNDPTLESRNRARTSWMLRTLPKVDLAFCTDGDWVHIQSSNYPQLVHLNQGADERVMGRGQVREKHIPGFPLLFTGGRNGGAGRTYWVDEMQRKYNGDFRWVPSRTYRRALADAIAESQIVLAPQEPVTDRYWSNRVYVTLGFEGFLLHPYSQGLAQQYVDGQEIVFYNGLTDLHEKIAYYLDHPTERRAIAEAGYKRTLRQHTYLHRVDRLLTVIKGRL